MFSGSLRHKDIVALVEEVFIGFVWHRDKVPSSNLPNGNLPEGILALEKFPFLIYKSVAFPLAFLMMSCVQYSLGRS